MSSNPDTYFKFKPSFTTFDNDQWRKGGMTCGGLKETTQAINYMYGAGRQNIIPDTNTDKSLISSIGIFQTNGLGQLSSGTSGPGTLVSTNMSVKNPVASSDSQYGIVQSTPNKINFVNYRDTDPTLVQNLRNNPLSIYAQGNNVKDKDIPSFFANINPENYSNYIHESTVDISDETKQLYIDGSPNVSILGLTEQNPFMGLGNVIANVNPEFSGKTYGGNDSSSVNDIVKQIYNKDSNDDYTCSKALVQFSQCYNVAPQILKSKMVVEGPTAQSNLPWGPIKVTGNPQTQQGGIWQNGNNNWPTKESDRGIENNNIVIDKPLPPKRFINPYKYGLPGTLVE